MEKNELIIFLDSNVFLQGKFFTEIDWKEIFDDRYKRIIIKVPFMVLKELDKLKYKNKRARKVISKISKFGDNKTLKKDVIIEYSILPPEWNNLKDKVKEILSEEEPDHKIIAEVLLFQETKTDQEIIFITGDFILYKLAEQLKLNTINWLDEKYIGIFSEEKKEQVKRPGLEVLFYENNEVNRTIERSPEIDPPQTLKIEDYNNNYKKEHDLYPLFKIKDRETLEKEIENYNVDFFDLYRYSEITFIVFNNTDHPFTNVDIYFKTQLEQNFIIKYKRDIEYPKKPEAIRQFTSFGTYIPTTPIIREPNTKYWKIESEKSDGNNIWKFGYNINKIKHNENVILYPIMIWIPKNPHLEKITFEVNFTQDQSGRIKPQKLIINLKT